MFARPSATSFLHKRRPAGGLLRLGDACDEEPGRNLCGRPDAPFFGRSIPDDMRVYAIGDIHGCANEFEDMLELIARDSCGTPTSTTVIILLGDLIDRGPDSRRVLQTVDLLRRSGLRVETIMGNHEEVLLDLVEMRTATFGSFFYKIGGRDTLLSYGAPADLIDRLPPDALADAVELCIPSDHIAMLSDFSDWVTYGDFFFTHAGIDPRATLAAQDPSTLRWIREPFIGWEGRKDKTVVHGHTIVPHVSTAPGRVGIDTGAYRTGQLTSLVLEGDTHRYLQTPPSRA